jgi:outer membrane protein OmpA-like peptidoglycan-associated protein
VSAFGRLVHNFIARALAFRASLLRESGDFRIGSKYPLSTLTKKVMKTLHTLRGASLRLWVLVIVLGLLGPGCAGLSRTEKGTVAGSTTGAVIGGAIGKARGNTAKGAVLGAVLGGAAGAIIGHRMDKQARDLEKELEDAEIERVGEGIIVTFDSGILFDFDSAALQTQARQNLQELAESLAEYGQTEVLVLGHTDGVGSDAYNLRLSQRRAEAAASYLIGRGVSPGRIRQEGKGENEPVASNASDSGRQQNRRVEVAIFADEVYQENATAG